MSARTVVVVVPAHDEEALLPAALAAIGRAARHPAVGATRVLTVVVADACRDRTAAVARDAGALVVDAAFRNPGRGPGGGGRPPPGPAPGAPAPPPRHPTPRAPPGP
ncbi:hypothetical protein ACFV0K_12390, partial [Streptomyces sp. NPDC059586]